MSYQLLEIEQVWSKRMNLAITEGRERERVYIDNVLTAVMLEVANKQHQAGLKLARDIVRGLPPQEGTK